jgi:MFS family permease
VVLLNENLFPADLGWRLAFGLGAVFGVAILLVRRNVPESPRWMFIHGKEGQAEELVQEIESRVEDSTDEQLEEVDEDITIRQRKSTGFGEIARTMVTSYPRRSVLGLSLFIGQAFLYNSVFFTFALVLSEILGVETASAPCYLVPGQRDLPDGDPNDGDRVLLRGRHRARRHHRPGPVREVHRTRS